MRDVLADPASIRLAFVAVASVIAMAVCASMGWKLTTLVPAALFAIFATLSALFVNLDQWTALAKGRHDVETQNAAVAGTARLAAVVFAWGAMVMFVLYHGVGLRWQHGWQYGLAMTVLAIGHVIYAKSVAAGDPRLTSQKMLDRTAQLAFVQGIVIVGALLWLLFSGKLSSTKGDWAANHVFVAGGLAIASLSFALAKSARRAPAGR